MTTSDGTKSIYAALLAAQREMPSIAKDGNNPHFKSKYITLERLRNTAVEVLHKHGILLMQPVDESPTGALLCGTRLVHVESGEWVESMSPIPLDKQTPQGAGSAITYGRRYSLAAILGVVSDADDDGETAMGRGRNGKPQTTEKYITKEERSGLIDLVKAAGHGSPWLIDKLRGFGVEDTNKITDDVRKKIIRELETNKEAA